MVLNEKIKAFVTHIDSLVAQMMIYLARNILILLLLIRKIIIMTKYLDLSDVFANKSVKVFLKRIQNNQNINKL